MGAPGSSRTNGTSTSPASPPQPKPSSTSKPSSSSSAKSRPPTTRVSPPRKRTPPVATLPTADTGVARRSPDEASAASASVRSSPVALVPTNAPRKTSGATSVPTPSALSTLSEAPSDNEETQRRDDARRAELSQLMLVVCQQPERARLCSFKEENETIDRRPVDPPPVIELRSKAGDYPDLLDSTSFFIRASLVSAELTTNATSDKECTEVKTPNGADATAGEVIQTPERLRHLDGKPGALCIFAKLSVRLPGVFRLKFTLYETAAEGITEICYTVSEPFEVFSPKLFKGMHESTPLTRHLATQGLKVKLRTDSSSSKGPGRRRTSVYRQQEAVAEMSPGPGSAGGHPPPLRYTSSLPPSTGAPSSAPPYSQYPSLAWRGHGSSYPEYDMSQRRSPAHDLEPARKLRRIHGDRDLRVGHGRRREDGMYALTDISSRLDFSLSSPSSDLSAFSLGRSHGRPQSASSASGYRRDWDSPRRDYASGDDGLPSVPLHAQPSPLGVHRGAPPDFALPRLPRIVPVVSNVDSHHQGYPPPHHGHHHPPSHLHPQHHQHPQHSQHSPHQHQHQHPHDYPYPPSQHGHGHQHSHPPPHNYPQPPGTAPGRLGREHDSRPILPPIRQHLDVPSSRPHLPPQL